MNRKSKFSILWIVRVISVMKYHFMENILLTILKTPQNRVHLKTFAAFFLVKDQQTNRGTQQLMAHPDLCYIYFSFLDKFDDPKIPNKIVLGKATPTIFDMCATIKALFLSGQQVTLTCNWLYNPLPEPLPENSPVFVDLQNVALIKLNCINSQF